MATYLKKPAVDVLDVPIIGYVETPTVDIFPININPNNIPSDLVSLRAQIIGAGDVTLTLLLTGFPVAGATNIVINDTEQVFPINVTLGALDTLDLDITVVNAPAVKLFVTVE
ncbi:MAG: hypothetical protein K1X66_02415 [Verrucomicrobiae bacterium]|nr:hypothetical protein [Verrucomicrobiae bacterium]